MHDYLEFCSKISIVISFIILVLLGFTEELRGQTHGTAFPQCVFDHWQMMPGDPQEAGTRAHTVVTDVRNRKGLNPVIPGLENYLDKL